MSSRSNSNKLAERQTPGASKLYQEIKIGEVCVVHDMGSVAIPLGKYLHDDFANTSEIVSGTTSYQHNR